MKEKSLFDLYMTICFFIAHTLHQNSLYRMRNFTNNLCQDANIHLQKIV